MYVHMYVLVCMYLEGCPTHIPLLLLLTKRPMTTASNETQYMRRLAEEEEDSSEREAQAEADAAAAAAANREAGLQGQERGGDGDGDGDRDVEEGGGDGGEEEALLRRPLRAGAPPPMYGGAGVGATATTAPAVMALPFLKWMPAAAGNTLNPNSNPNNPNSNGSIGMSPLPSPSGQLPSVLRASDSLRPSPGPNNGNEKGQHGNGAAGARLV
jgi:hypothetical protein